MATQNPIEHEGTYPLPEAQMDRFMLKCVITYPEFDDEQQIIRSNINESFGKVKPVVSIKEIIKLTNDSSGLVRTCAYGALGHLEAKQSAKELHKGIFDSNLEAVKSAAYSLARIKEKISDEELEELHRLDEPEFDRILKFFN